MAHAALVSLVNTLELQLRCHLQKQQRESLREKATVLLEFLENSTQNNNEIGLEEKIRDAAHEVEDIVESQILDDKSGDHSIKFYVDQFDSIIEEVKRVKNTCSGEDQKPRNSLPVVPTGPASNRQTIMVGSDDNLKQIMNRLMGLQSELEVISIVGMGGIGKTTLATALCNDPRTQSHFATRGWATVSQIYSVPHILRTILESMNMLTDQMCQEDNIAVLSEHLYRILMKSARYLIVLDDLWDKDAWDSLGRIFPERYNGSRIIITTRLRDIALYASSNSTPHQMQLMNKEESWNLLHKTVFEEKYCTPELEQIGKNIAESCRGLPLAIVVTGGLLAKLKKDEWEDLAYRVSSVLTLSNIDDDQCLEVLALSYNHLSQHLKACFLYMGAFPEDDEIPASKLIKLWVAEGFLKHATYGNTEEVAEQHLEELAGRNLILVRKQRFNGKIKTCSIHDQLRKLCLKEAQKNNFLCWVDNNPQTQASDRMRRVSFPSSTLITEAIKFPFSRSILCHTLGYRIERSFISCFRLLRVLDLGHCYYKFHFEIFNYQRFPDAILELTHLRYLCIRCYGEVPASLTKLKNLQTLILLPDHFLEQKFYTDFEIKNFLNCFEIWKMPWLRHVNGCIIKSFYPPIHLRSGPENLRSLFWIEASACTRKFLKEFPNLRKLGIQDWGSRWKDEALFINNLVCLQQLETLTFKVNSMVERLSADLCGKLVFPESLKKLTLMGTEFPWEEMRIIGSLPNLQVLKLKWGAFHGSTWESRDGEFPHLQVLVIENLSDLQEWRAEDTHFPNLHHLTLKLCNRLKGIPNAIGDIPTLETIELHDCSTLAETSAREIQQEQEELGNNIQVLIYSTEQFYDDYYY